MSKGRFFFFLSSRLTRAGIKLLGNAAAGDLGALGGEGCVAESHALGEAVAGLECGHVCGAKEPGCGGKEVDA